MPAGNKFRAHIYLATPNGRDESQIPESCKKVSDDGKVVSCFIPAAAGGFFKTMFWYTGPNDSAFPYSAMFLRDGECVSHVVFDRIEAQRIAGTCSGVRDDEGDMSYFQFKRLVISDEETSSKTPEEAGRLEVIIRRDKSLPLTGKIKRRRERRRRIKFKAFDDEDSDFKEERPQKSRRKARWMSNTAQKEKNHELHLEWNDAKPRQTHTSVLAKLDDRIWKQPVCDLKELDLPKPDEVEQFIDKSDEDLIVKFVFYYTSQEHIKLLRKPVASHSPELEISSSDEDEQMDEGAGSMPPPEGFLPFRELLLPGDHPHPSPAPSRHCYRQSLSYIDPTSPSRELGSRAAKYGPYIKREEDPEPAHIPSMETSPVTRSTSNCASDMPVGSKPARGGLELGLFNDTDEDHKVAIGFPAVSNSEVPMEVPQIKVEDGSATFQTPIECKPNGILHDIPNKAALHPEASSSSAGSKRPRPQDSTDSISEEQWRRVREFDESQLIKREAFIATLRVKGEPVDASNDQHVHTPGRFHLQGSENVPIVIDSDSD